MIHWLPSVVLVLMFFFFLPSHNKDSQHTMYRMENGCLVYALHTKMVLEASEKLQPHLWTRIIAIQFEKQLGHAILVFVYKNMTYIYDPAQGSFVAARYPMYDAQQLAEIAYPKTTILKAHFLEPTLTLNSIIVP